MRRRASREVTASRLDLGSIGAAVIAPILPRLFIVPRSRNNIFESGSTENVRELLSGYLSGRPLSDPLRAIEFRFYIDIATNQRGTFMARRRLTALLLKPDGTLMANKRVEWTRAGGSTQLRFLDSGGNLQQSLTGANAVQTDANGMAEVIISHPARRVTAADAALTIRAEADGERGETILTITRNDAVTRQSDIERRSDREADHIWVYQPDSNHRTPLNQGIKDLQEVLNEVVSRYRGINPFTFIPLDGVFGNEVRDALRLYLTNFTNVHGPRWPYDLRNIGLSQHLRNYLRDEYAPFDPNTAGNQGWIVDRRLLIGDRWDTAPTRIDGLSELKEGVVDRLRAEMVRVANDYINCNTFWLHRPNIPNIGHVPYQQAATWVFRIRANNVRVKTGAGAAAPNLLDGAGNPVTVNAGELFPSPATVGTRTQIAHALGNGWVSSNRGRRVRDDQSRPVNHGIHGGPGVAYSYGCKDLPATYTNQLNTNPHAPPMDGGGTRRRVAHWDEYARRHRVGRRRGDGVGANAWTGENRIPYHAGCDCGGLVQNCITEAMFPATNVRVVPNALTRAIRITAHRTPRFAIAAGNFVGNNANARPVPRPANDAQRQWIRQGDLIARTGHIVWVAENLPANNNRILNNNNLFQIFQEKGSCLYRLPNGAQAPLDNTRFLRKAVRTPFHYWRRTLAGLDVGKVYIWR
jgi:hypothetical protein